NDGTRITTKEQWRCRRNEIKKDIEKYEIGPKPEPPTVKANLQGNTLTVTVTTNAGSIMLSSTVSSPSGAGPHCVAIGMNGNSSLISGCVQVPFKHDQVVSYNGGSGSQNQNDPFYKLYPDLWGQIGNYNAWSWGISRLIDGLEQVKDQLDIDMSRIGVHGCSYAGKMALFAGALDERIALTVAQESGGGGINSWRTSQSFTSRTGTNIEKIDNTNYAWFKSSMKNLDPYSLPHDHHELIAMIAPRAVIALGNPGYEWLGDESGYKSVMAAKEVFKALGVEDHIGFDFAGNHRHCQAAQSQQQAVTAFVNRFLKGQNANTNIAVPPQQSGFDLNYQSLINWETPTLQ
ncbi:MAG: glycoside hydrolase family 10, partial [Pseudomonadota bacterium]